MNPLVIPYPQIDPVLFQIGPLAIRWYALAYIAGLVIGWQLIRRLCEQPPKVLSPVKIDDFLLWAALGVILGGRLGYVLFYKPGFYLANPLSILTLWEGGMSFHGGFLGVIIATIVFCRRNQTDPFMLGDLLAIVSPIGLFFGRLANFINGELWGRISDVQWAMIFPRGGPLPRHPSQLYQAFFEGVLLFSSCCWCGASATAGGGPGCCAACSSRAMAWRASSANSSASQTRISATCGDRSRWACCCRYRCWSSAAG